MVEKKKQVMRYTDEEINLIKQTFADNDELHRAIFNTFLQLPLSAVEQSILIPIKNHPQVLGILQKAFLPTITDENVPLAQTIDLWMTIDVKDKTPEDGLNAIKAREKLIDYLKQQLGVLSGKKAEPIKLADCIKIKGKKADEVYQDILMRNTLIYHVQQQLMHLGNLAVMKEETPEESKKRLAQNSAK